MDANVMIKKPKKTKRINRGVATNDLVYSAYHDTNDVVFPHILSLYVPEGAKVADVTFGKGVFWKRVDPAKYRLFPSDLRRGGLPEGCRGGIDSRKLPYADRSLDALVFDPPYMHTPGGTAHNGHQNYEDYYGNNVEQDGSLQQASDESQSNLPKYHEAVLDLYFRSAREAKRVLRSGGIYIVKCGDEVCTNRQRLTHVEIINRFQEFGFTVEDLFVVLRKNRPGVSRLMGRQYHARKNHSYFIVFRKTPTSSIEPERLF